MSHFGGGHTIKDREAKSRTQHPVGMTAMGDWGAPLHGGDGPYEGLIESPADWISPSTTEGGNWIDDPPVEDRKIVLLDTDHILGWKLPPVSWVWKSFTRGHNPIYMGPLEDISFYKLDPNEVEAIRRNLGYTLRYAQRMNLTVMRPRNDLSSTTSCLANPSAEYLVYQPNSGSFTVTLESGTYSVEWCNSATGDAFSGGSITAEKSSRSFRPPFSGDAVLYLKRIT